MELALKYNLQVLEKIKEDMDTFYFKIRGDEKINSWDTKTLYVNNEKIYSEEEVAKMLYIGEWISCGAPIKTKNSVKRPTDNWKKTISQSKWLRCVEDENCFVIDSLAGVYYNPKIGFIYRIIKNCNNKKIYVSVNLRKVSMLKDSSIADYYDKLVEDYYDEEMKIAAINSCNSKEGDAELFEDLKESLEECIEIKKEREKSTGGKSNYYKIVLPEWLIEKQQENGYIMLEDLAEVMFDNDFNFTNVFKAQKRMFEMTKGGGKEGNTFEYDATKCKYYVDKQVEVFNR